MLLQNTHNVWLKGHPLVSLWMPRLFPTLSLLVSALWTAGPAPEGEQGQDVGVPGNPAEQSSIRQGRGRLVVVMLLEGICAGTGRW